MTRLLPCLLALFLATPALAKTIPCEAVARGDDGPAKAKLEELTTQKALDRWKTGLAVQPGRTLVAISLGEQPAGTRFVGAQVSERDKYGWSVHIRARVRMPAKAKKTARPFVVLSFQGRPMSIEHSVRVRLRLGKKQKAVRFQTMSLEAATKTRAKLAAMSRRQRRDLARLNGKNRVLRGRLLRLEEQVLAYAKDPTYLAGGRALSFEKSLKISMEIAGLETDRHFFGSTINPMITTGDEGIKYLSQRNKRNWSKDLAQAYAKEAAEIEKKITEMEQLLKSMQAVAAKAPAGEAGGLVEVLGKN